MSTIVNNVFTFTSPRRSLCNRILWLVIVFVNTTAMFWLWLNSWNRFNNNATVLSIQKDYRNWYNTFPSVVGCFQNKFDEQKGVEFIYKEWNVSNKDPKFEYYMKFLNELAHYSSETLVNLLEFKNDSKISNLDLLNIIYEIHPTLSTELNTFNSHNSSQWTLIVTEKGLCFAMNSKTAHYFNYKSEINDEVSKFDNLSCHYLDGLCYARHESDSTNTIEYYVFSPYEVFDIDMVPNAIINSKSIEINFNLQETMSSTNLNQLSIRQRKCHFYNEPIDEDLPFYSENLCRIKCRLQYLLDNCGCKPFFYYRFDGRPCSYHELECISIFSFILPETNHSIREQCNCLPTCNVLNYRPENIQLYYEESNLFISRFYFRWGLISPTTKYRIDVIFGFVDLITSIGGSASLLLGISFLSLLKLVYIFIRTVTTSIVSS